ncbi:MAG: cysteine--tRNA ligase [Candidatus Omnitrophota bacterium]
MSLKIYNTLTKQKEEFVPVNPEQKRVNMYTCGVTVYDKSHIGHARSLYTFDMIRRYLVFRGYDVHFVRNITDVDDKIINKARELGQTSEEVAKKNIEGYYADLRSLGVPPADHEPRAADPENIAEMIRFIKGMIEKGTAYEADGDVYFRVRTFKDYGKLSGQSIENMLDAVRIEKDVKKEDPLDFALWKKSKSGEPFWESPWGPGRPGWHIECSCMSLKHLGCETLDIHGGGRDLQFPHHENEIAQAESFTGKPFAKYWIHHGLLTINSQKMAKSLGNFITIEDAVNDFGADVLKLFFLSAHYTSSIDFSEKEIYEAAKQRERMVTFLHRAEETAGGSDSVDSHKIFKYRDALVDAMDDDFNTAKAMAVLFELMSDVNRSIDQGKDLNLGEIAMALNVFKEFMFQIFNLELKEKSVELTDEIAGFLKEREAARGRKDFAESDRLRDVLKEKGYLVQDTKEGQTWKKI